MKLPLMKAGTVPPEPMPGGCVECEPNRPFVLDDEMIEFLRTAMVWYMTAGDAAPISAATRQDLQEAVIEVSKRIAESMRESRRLIEAVVEAEKQLGQGTWTGPGSLLHLVDAAKSLGRMLP